MVQGRLSYRHGGVYEGAFHHGLKNGYGKYIYPHGGYYEGQWVNGKQEGLGAYYDSQNNPIKIGYWKNGIF